MRTITVGSLLEKLRRDPASSLGARSHGTLTAYVEGYAAAIHHHRVATLVDELGASFRQWADAQILLTEEHASRLNARSAIGPESIALLCSEDEHAAFDVYLELRMQCCRELGPTARAEPFQSWGEDLSLFGLLATIRARPGMFFGNSRVENCWALVRGYQDAESEHGVTSIQSAQIRRFQSWVDERYPFACGQPWWRAFRFLAIAPEHGIEVFFEHLDLFVSDAPPDAPDPTMSKMLAAIGRHHKKL